MKQKGRKATAKNPFKGMDELELRRAAGESVRKVAQVLADKLSPDDAWRLLLSGAVMVMLREMGENRWMRKDIDQVFSDMAVAEAYKDSTYYERRAHCA